MSIRQRNVLQTNNYGTEGVCHNILYASFAVIFIRCICVETAKISAGIRLLEFSPFFFLSEKGSRNNILNDTPVYVKMSKAIILGKLVQNCQF